jgi:hypothetical protein
LILPATIFGFGSVVLLTSSNVLLAANNLRKRFAIMLAQAIAALLAVGTLLARSHIVFYSWAVAVLQVLAALLSLILAAEYFEANWFGRVCAIPSVASLTGAAASLSIQEMLQRPVIEQLGINTIGYCLIAALVLRFFFASFVRDSLKLLPYSQKLTRLVGLAGRRHPP